MDTQTIKKSLAQCWTRESGYPQRGISKSTVRQQSNRPIHEQKTGRKIGLQVRKIGKDNKSKKCKWEQQ